MEYPNRTLSFFLRDKNSVAGKMSYKDFVWFLLSEEDKTTPRRLVG